MPKLVHDEVIRFGERREQVSKQLFNIYTVQNQLNNPTFSPLALTNFTPQ